MAVNQTKDYLENGNIVNSVNFPHCEMSWNTNWRIAIMHKNVPKMVSQITSALAKEHINIIDMMNKSAGDWAYTIIDTSTKIACEALPELEKIDGIVRMRFFSK